MEIVEPAIIAGLSPDDLNAKESVVVATVVNGALATVYENGDIVDGVTLTTGDRILLKNQTAGAENGIYVVKPTGTPRRSDDANSVINIVQGIYVFVTEGTTNGGTSWILNTDNPITPDTTSQNWIRGKGDTVEDLTGGESSTFIIDGIDSANPVNYLEVSNASTGNDPDIAAAGTDTDIDVSLTPKGNAGVIIGGSSATATIDITASNVLDIDGTGGLILPDGTTAQRPGSPVDGTIRYNTDLNIIESRVNGAWNNLSFGISTLQTTDATKVNIATGALVPGEVSTIVAEGQGIESASGDVYWFTISGAVKNITGTTSLVGTPNIIEDSDIGASTWTVGLEADDTGDNWELTVTGQASKTIDWKISHKEVKQ